MAEEIDPFYNGIDLRQYAPEIPLADKRRIAEVNGGSAFIHSVPEFVRNAILRAAYKLEQE